MGFNVPAEFTGRCQKSFLRSLATLQTDLTHIKSLLTIVKKDHPNHHPSLQVLKVSRPHSCFDSTIATVIITRIFLYFFKTDSVTATAKLPK